MNYESDLDFVCEVFKKCHLRTALISTLDPSEVILDTHLSSIVSFEREQTVGQMLGVIEKNTKYLLTDELNLKYIFVLLPLLSEKNILAVGPYLSAMPSTEDILEIAEQAGIPLGAQRAFGEYYGSVPVLAEGDRAFVVLDTLLERVWQTPSFAISELSKSKNTAVAPIAQVSLGEGFEEIEANIRMMEMRYSFENELIRAVTLGQQHKENLLVSKLSENMFERRTADPLRNARNYSIIMNTLLRKAAENGGVHPVHLDRISSDFARKIELSTDTRACTALMREMFSTYCRLVYKHSMRGYSPIVQKTVLHVDSDISAELSLKSLAQKQGISPGYLATIFKKETGKTVSEYVRDKRIDHAMHLLRTTHLQIQTVALHCGIMDVQYFSKIFKRKTGKNPKEYRDTVGR